MMVSSTSSKASLSSIVYQLCFIKLSGHDLESHILFCVRPYSSKWIMGQPGGLLELATQGSRALVREVTKNPKIMGYMAEWAVSVILEDGCNVTKSKRLKGVYCKYF